MATQDIFNMTDTWNAGGTTFTAIKMNVTDSASAAASLLMDLQVGSASKFSVSKTGALVSALGANTAAIAVTGYSLTGSNAQSLVDLAGTWNTSGTPTAIKLTITDTASNVSSMFLDLRTSVGSVFSVGKGGQVVSAGGITLAQGVGLLTSARGGIQFDGNGTMQFFNAGFTNNVKFKIATTDLLEIMNNDAATYAFIKGKLRSSVNATAETPTATHTIRVFDGGGTEYKVLCVAA